MINRNDLSPKMQGKYDAYKLVSAKKMRKAFTIITLGLTAVTLGSVMILELCEQVREFDEK